MGAQEVNFLYIFGLFIIIIFFLATISGNFQNSGGAMAPLAPP